MIAIIAAVAKNNVIGKNGELPWELPKDMENFKRLTSGNTVVMGRKTFESIGRPLPNRNNVVVSRSMEDREDVDVCRGIEEALETAKDYGEDIFIIGGQSIYEQTIDKADVMFISHVKMEVDGDTYFPEIGDEWQEVERKEFDKFDLVKYER